MDRERLRTLLEAVRAGETTTESALESLATLPFEDIGFAHVDHHRALREGFPEVVLGLGKTPQQIAEIGARISEHAQRLLVTRATPDQYAALVARVPDAMYHPVARAISVDRIGVPGLPGVGIVCAGTADLPVAEEAALTAALMGCTVTRLYDVGVAGLHRLLAHLKVLRSARVLIVVAGMEGALPSVIGGLVAVPVIAVPTSIGYGASFQGLAALLGMLNSCAAGVSVVNIDNGFGAGYSAALINRLPPLPVEGT
jgi:NCAIR mutase (PurE)-related protein